jgi:hypothetical protein
MLERILIAYQYLVKHRMDENHVMFSMEEEVYTPLPWILCRVSREL